MTSKVRLSASYFFFFNDTATTEIYTLSLHDALPISECAAADAVDVLVTAFDDVARLERLDVEPGRGGFRLLGGLAERRVGDQLRAGCLGRCGLRRPHARLRRRGRRAGGERRGTPDAVVGPVHPRPSPARD